MICKGLVADRISLLDHVGKFLWIVPLLALSQVCEIDHAACIELYMLDAEVFASILEILDLGVLMIVSLLM